MDCNIIAAYCCNFVTVSHSGLPGVTHTTGNPKNMNHGTFGSTHPPSLLSACLQGPRQRKELRQIKTDSIPDRNAACCQNSKSTGGGAKDMSMPCPQIPLSLVPYLPNLLIIRGVKDITMRTAITAR